MKYTVIKLANYLLLAPVLLLLAFACKSDNALQSSLTDYDPILDLSRYISYNRSSANQVKGVYTLSMSGTQSFAPYYWGWEQGTPESVLNKSNTVTDTSQVPEYFLSNHNKTINTVRTFNDNYPSGPQYFQTHTGYPPFADESFPNTRASSGVIRPLSFASIERTLFNSSNELAYDAALRTYSLSYNSSTGQIQSYAILTQNNTDNSVALVTFGFSSDPRSTSSYYTSSYIEKSGTNNTLVGSVTTAIEVDSTVTNSTETYTYKRFDENGALGSFTASSDLDYLGDGFFNSANGQTIVKIVTTITTYRTASGSISANSIGTVTEKFSSNTNVVFKEVTIKHYEDSNLLQLADYQYMTYNVSGSTETRISQDKKWYSDGFLVLDQDYTSGVGWTSPSSYIVYTRDAQGRITSKKHYNTAGELDIKQNYTFYSDGRTETIRSYQVDSSSVETCYNTTVYKNSDYTYSTSAGSKLISETRFLCDGDTVSTSPSTRHIWTYNSTGKLTEYQKYDYLTSSFVLDEQTRYEYGSSGERLVEQRYTVSGGSATAGIRYEYIYDSNLFQTSEIIKDSSGQIATGYYVYSYSYR